MEKRSSVVKKFDPDEKFRRIIAAVERRKIPLWLHIDLTYRCNLNCIHCYCRGLSEDYLKGKEELSRAEIKNTLDELSRIGALYLTLSGGEVLMRDDFLDAAAYARMRNFTVTVFTNGTLIDGHIAKEFRSLAIAAVELSLYGVTAGVHDAVTQTPGSFDAVKEAAAVLKKHGLRVVLKTTFMEQNYHQSRQIPGFSYEMGADDFRFTVELSPKNDGCRLPQGLQLSGGKMRDILHHTMSGSGGDEYRQNPLDKPLCGSGSIGCYISPYGDVYPCAQLLMPMGNVREKSFRAIWHADSGLRRELASLRTYGDLTECRLCPYVRHCRKCMGLAQLETGDMRACYTTLKEIAQAVGEV